MRTWRNFLLLVTLLFVFVGCSWFGSDDDEPEEIEPNPLPSIQEEVSLRVIWNKKIGKGAEDREQAKRELLAYKGPEYDAEMTNNILKHRLLSEGAFRKENEAKLLTDQKFLNGSTVEYIYEEITAWNNGEVGVWGYPPQLQAYAKYKQITNRKALQTVFNIYTTL